MLNFLKRFAAGHTDYQKQQRYDRANARSTDYMSVVQWYVENADGTPPNLPDYAALAALTFKTEHKPLLRRCESDINRKLGHATHIGTRQSPWITAFMRPEDNTVYCAYVLLRDDNQQFAVMTPYWFLSRGEKEGDYRSPVMNVI